MISKNSFIKLTTESIKRRLSIMIMICLVFFFRFVVPAMFLWAERYQYLTWKESFTKSFFRMVAFQNGATLFWILVMAVLCGLSGFHYLNSKAKIDFYHSLPVRREVFFISNYTAGILMVALPYLLFLLAAVGIGILGGVSGVTALLGTALLAFLYHMIFYLLIYSTVTLAVMLTGHLVIGMLGTLTFFGYFPLLLVVFMGLFETSFETSYWGMSGWVERWLVRCSPVTAYFNAVFNYGSGYRSTGYSVWPQVLCAFGVALVLTVMCLLLYRKRPSEGAGKALVFELSKPIIRIMIVLLCALLMALAFDAIHSVLFWVVFGLLCGAVISHCLMEAIYHFDVKRIFAHWQQLLICIAMSIFVICSFRYDIFGYDRYLPQAQQIRSSAIDIASVDDWVDYGTYVRDDDGFYRWEWKSASDYVFEQMQLLDSSTVLEIAAAGIAWNEQNEEDISYNSSYRTNVNIQYTLKNGRKISRSYYVPIDLIFDSIVRLYEEQDYQIGKYPILTQASSEVAALEYEEGGEYYRIDSLTSSEKELLLSAYQQELSELTIERRTQELPIATLRFVSKDAKRAISNNNISIEQKYYYDDFSQYEFYPLYPSQTKTINILQKMQVPAGTLWSQLPISQIQWDGLYYPNGESPVTTVDEEPELIVTDPKQISQMMKYSVPAMYLSWNQFYQKQGLVGFEATYEIGANTRQSNRLIPEQYLPREWQQIKSVLEK